MTITKIKYGKSLTIYQESKEGARTYSRKVSDLVEEIKNLECFSIQLSKNLVKRTTKKLENLGFEISIDENWGFDWEVKMYGTK